MLIPKTPAGNEICSLVVWRDSIYSGSYNGILKQWQRGKCIQTLEDCHESSVSILVVWNNLMYSGSHDYTIKKWNEEGLCLQTFQGHSTKVNDIKIWNGFLYSAALDEIKKWDQEGVCLETYRDDGLGEVNCLLPWNDYIYSGSDEGEIKQWNQEGVCVMTFSTSTLIRSLVVFDNYLWSGSEGGKIECWNEEGECVKTFNNNSRVLSLCVWHNFLCSGDGSYYDYCSAIKKWNENGNCIDEFLGNDDYYLGHVNSLLVWKDRMYYGSADGDVREWVDEEWEATRIRLKMESIRNLLLIFVRSTLRLNVDIGREIATFF